MDGQATFIPNQVIRDVQAGDFDTRAALPQIHRVDVGLLGEGLPFGRCQIIYFEMSHTPILCQRLIMSRANKKTCKISLRLSIIAAFAKGNIRND